MRCVVLAWVALLLLASAGNATGQDYRLNPLNVYQEIPRSQTVITSLRFVF